MELSSASFSVIVCRMIEFSLVWGLKNIRLFNIPPIPTAPACLPSCPTVPLKPNNPNIPLLPRPFDGITFGAKFGFRLQLAS